MRIIFVIYSFNYLQLFLVALDIQLFLRQRFLVMEFVSLLIVSGLFIVGLVPFLYMLRKHIRGPRFKEDVDARNYVAIITGSNSGIG